MSGLGALRPLLLAAAGAAGLAQLARLSAPWKYRRLYETVGAGFDVDPNLLHALSAHESAENTNAIGGPNPNGTRDYGLMQINESNFAGLGLTQSNWRDPATNITAGARHLTNIKRDAPGLGFLDTLSVYNAGLSTHGPRPKLDAAGRYINQRYVREVATWYAIVTVASFAPIQRVAA